MSSIESAPPIVEAPPAFLPFDEVLDNLTAAMRQYDELNETRTSLIQDLEAREEQVGSIDVHLPAEVHPPEAAYAALGLYITQRKLTIVTGQRNAIERLYSPVAGPRSGLEGRRVSVESTDPERYKLLALRKNIEGSYMGLGRFYTAKKGRIVKAGLRPSEGGYMILQGRVGRFYEIIGLIDRDINYRPTFKITEL